MLVAKKANSFKGGFIRAVLHSCPRMGGVVVCSHSRLGRFRLGRGCPNRGCPRLHFFVNSIHSLRHLAQTYRKISIVVRTTTVGRISATRCGPRRYVGAGMRNTRGIVGTTLTANMRRIITLSASGTYTPVGLCNTAGLASSGLFATTGGVDNSGGVQFSMIHCNGIVNSHNSMVPFFVGGHSGKTGRLPVASLHVAHFGVSLRTNITLIVCTVKRRLNNRVFVPGVPSCRVRSITATVTPGLPRIRINVHPKRGLRRRVVAMASTLSAVSLNECCIVLPSMSFGRDHRRFVERRGTMPIPSNFRCDDSGGAR